MAGKCNGWGLKNEEKGGHTEKVRRFGIGAWAFVLSVIIFPLFQVLSPLSPLALQLSPSRPHLPPLFHPPKSPVVERTKLIYPFWLMAWEETSGQTQLEKEMARLVVVFAERDRDRATERDGERVVHQRQLQ